VERVLENREAGSTLKQQAVLFRTSHPCGPLEVALTRRNIPFVKFGGLKFLDGAHIRDILSLSEVPAALARSKSRVFVFGMLRRRFFAPHSKNRKAIVLYSIVNRFNPILKARFCYQGRCATPGATRSPAARPQVTFVNGRDGDICIWWTH